MIVGAVTVTVTAAVAVNVTSVAVDPTVVVVGCCSIRKHYECTRFKRTFILVPESFKTVCFVF